MPFARQEYVMAALMASNPPSWIIHSIMDDTAAATAAAAVDAAAAAANAAAAAAYAAVEAAKAALDEVTAAARQAS